MEATSGEGLGESKTSTCMPSHAESRRGGPEVDWAQALGFEIAAPGSAPGDGSGPADGVGAWGDPEEHDKKADDPMFDGRMLDSADEEVTTTGRVEGAGSSQGEMRVAFGVAVGGDSGASMGKADERGAKGREEPVAEIPTSVGRAEGSLGGEVPPAASDASQSPSSGGSEGSGEPRPKARRKSLLVGKRMKINLSRCSYDSIKSAAKGIGWSTTKKDWQKSKQWSVLWSDHGCLQQEELATLTPLQKFNHFAGMVEICAKCSLARHLNRMKAAFPDRYDFHPRSWVLPGERAQLEMYMRLKGRGAAAKVVVANRRRKSKSKKSSSDSASGSSPSTMLIVKPDDGCKGIGIFLTDRVSKIPKEKSVVVQEYVPRPLLINGHKFDLRLYVLVTSCHPRLRCFLYREGLTRFATHKYQAPKSSNLSNTYMHLTNYAINKKNSDFEGDWASGGEESDGDAKEGSPTAHGGEEDEHFEILNRQDGSRWSLTALMNWFEKRGQDTEHIRDQLKDVAVKTLMAVRPRLNFLYRSIFKQKEDEGFRCFELLGIDVLLDEDLHPLLLEVNQSPSFHCDFDLDNAIKGPLLRDTLRLASADVELARKRARSSDAHFDVEEWREQFEDANCGKFERIYPHAGDKYDELANFTPSLLKETNAMSRKREEAVARRKALEEAQEYERAMRAGGAIAREAMRKRSRANKPPPSAPTSSATDSKEEKVSSARPKSPRSSTRVSLVEQQRLYAEKSKRARSASPRSQRMSPRAMAAQAGVGQGTTESLGAVQFWGTASHPSEAVGAVAEYREVEAVTLPPLCVSSRAVGLSVGGRAVSRHPSGPVLASRASIGASGRFVKPTTVMLGGL